MCRLRVLLICVAVYPLQSIAVLFQNNACRELKWYNLDTFLPTIKCYHNRDVFSNVPDMVTRSGYRCNSYSVTTKTGYKLTIFRVKSKTKQGKGPVFLEHGIVTNSGPWVDRKDRSLAFNLVDMGYEVWLGNLRGTTYSREHVKLNISDPSYWNFNLDTLAQEDVRTQLHFVANKTGNSSNIIYIGHSMGTTLAFMYFSDYPEESRNIVKGYIALAPAVYFINVKSIEMIRPIVLPLIELLDTLEIKGLFYQEDTIHRTLITFCRFFPEVCYDILVTVPGKSTEFLPEDLLLYFSYWPSGGSIYQFKQYLQISQSGIFQKYDFGSEENTRVYGTAQPPSYKLSNINIPMWLFYGKSDSIYNEESIDRLYRELGGNTTKQPIPTSNASYFNHIDFMYAGNIQELLYKNLFLVLNKL